MERENPDEVLHKAILEEAKQTLANDIKNKKLGKEDPTLTRLKKNNAQIVSKKEPAPSYATIDEFYEDFKQFATRADVKYGASGIPTVVKGATLAEVEYTERVIGEAIAKAKPIPREDKIVKKVFSVMGEGLVVKLATEKWFKRMIEKNREQEREFMKTTDSYVY